MEIQVVRVTKAKRIKGLERKYKTGFVDPNNWTIG
jgi:hypothetical protein